MSTPQLVVHRDKELMAQAAAARLITKVVDAQASRGSASVVLTGGRNGNGLLAALAAAPARDAVDWSRIDLWWGDERYLPEGDPERNYTQACEALLTPYPWTRSACTPCPRRTARTVPGWRPRRRPTPRSWPGPLAPRTTARCPPSTS